MEKTSGEKLGRDVASEAVEYAALLKVPIKNRVALLLLSGCVAFQTTQKLEEK